MPDNRPNDDDQLAFEIFRRNLNEVHLLMDFISSLPGKGLSDLILPDPNPNWTPISANQRRPYLDATASVARISEIRFPPSPNPATRAVDATVLLLAKDKLNDLARPARGRSIAYTTMFSGGVPWFSRKQNPSRYDLALGAFPELIRHVHFFKGLYWFLLVFGLAWLLFTGFTYWDVALGNSVLKNITAIETERDNLYKANPTLADCRVAGAAGQSGSPGQGAASNQQGAAPNQNTACLRLEQLRYNENAAAKELGQYAGCSGVWRFLALRCWPGTEFIGRTLQRSDSSRDGPS